jgi:hypothetical protein
VNLRRIRDLIFRRGYTSHFNFVKWQIECTGWKKELWNTIKWREVRLCQIFWILFPLLPISNHYHEVLQLTYVLWVSDSVRTFIRVQPPKWVWKNLQRNVSALHKKLPSLWKILDTNCWKVCYIWLSKLYTLIKERSKGKILTTQSIHQWMKFHKLNLSSCW